MLIINTEEVLNEHGDLVRIIYHHEDGRSIEKVLFISAKELIKIRKQIKSNNCIPQYKSGENKNLK